MRTLNFGVPTISSSGRLTVSAYTRPRIEVTTPKVNLASGVHRPSVIKLAAQIAVPAVRLAPRTRRFSTAVTHQRRCGNTATAHDAIMAAPARAHVIVQVPG